MAFYNRNGERKRIPHDIRRQEEEVVRSLCRMGSRPISPRSMQEQEKRIRREIANSNERRRMQSINAGFQYLRTLLPQGEGEKLSKASILQQTADYVYHLEREKAALLEQNCQLKRTVLNSSNNHDSDGSSDSPFPKRKKLDAGDLPDEGIGILSPAGSDSNVDEMKREINELRFALEHERSIRAILQEQVKNLESRLGVTEKTFDVALQDHLSYHTTENQGKLKMFETCNRSPKPNMLLDVDHFHTVPESDEHEVPEDLSGKNDTPSYCTSREVPNGVAAQPLQSSPPAFAVELEVSSHQEPYKHSTSRQNLETIVEAIRHLEGDHMFRDDPVPPKSPVRQWSSTERTGKSFEEQTFQVQQHLGSEQALQHQIIRNAPVSQSRPGVIVSKLS